MTVRKPCPTCPWWIGARAADIPNFNMELAERLAGTSTGELGAPMMSCHQSREGGDFVCAGWLARHGADSLFVRMALAGALRPAQGSLKGITVEGLGPADDWPELHETVEQVIDKLRQQTEDEDE